MPSLKPAWMAARPTGCGIAHPVGTSQSADARMLSCDSRCRFDQAGAFVFPARRGIRRIGMNTHPILLATEPATQADRPRRVRLVRGRLRDVTRVATMRYRWAVRSLRDADGRGIAMALLAKRSRERRTHAFLQRLSSAGLPPIHWQVSCMPVLVMFHRFRCGHVTRESDCPVQSIRSAPLQ